MFIFGEERHSFSFPHSLVDSHEIWSKQCWSLDNWASDEWIDWIFYPLAFLVYTGRDGERMLRVLQEN